VDFVCLRGQDVVGLLKKCSRKDSWYQDYSILLTTALPVGRPALFVPETARNITKQTVAISVERTIRQTTEVFLFL